MTAHLHQVMRLVFKSPSHAVQHHRIVQAHSLYFRLGACHVVELAIGKGAMTAVIAHKVPPKPGLLFLLGLLEDAQLSLVLLHHLYKLAFTYQTMATAAVSWAILQNQVHYP